MQAALDEIMTKQKWTTVVIAHRLWTIRNADKIAVVDKGKVVEEGTYDELLAAARPFYKLAKKQEEMGARSQEDGNRARRWATRPRQKPPSSPSRRRSRERGGARRLAQQGRRRARAKKAAKKKDEVVPLGRVFKVQGGGRVWVRRRLSRRGRAACR